MRVALLSLVLVGCATQAPQAPKAIDGNRLYSLMTGTPADRETGLSYVAGVSDTESAYAAAVKGLALPDAAIAIMICRPPAAIHQQAGDVVLQYMQANPAERHQSAYAVTRAALNKAWPCKT